MYGEIARRLGIKPGKWRKEDQELEKDYERKVRRQWKETRTGCHGMAETASFQEGYSLR